MPARRIVPRIIGYVARELAPAGVRSSPLALEPKGPATQSNGSKLPRHKWVRRKNRRRHRRASHRCNQRC
ncbi:hypothetical protein DOZ80_27520 [Pseudomonas fluorescens]|uniref:Uncharacterized protein n=1 Tax=Pseudomonas fluorescens TaxID=294 RepID=A0A327MLD1_PSEFL|nr:hypothetical protein DOZ80_27520 [Pseudomonas fluorescens]